MNIKRAKEEIKDAIAAYLMKDALGEYVIPPIRQRPVLLIGPPGVGKTQIMEQIAQEDQIGLVAYTITHHTRQSAIGLPFINKKIYSEQEYAVTEYTMSEIVASIYNKMEETGLKEGILFIDEINCVSETLAPTMLQFLQCKTFGSHKIPEGWIIVAAGNPPEYNKSVREFDMVTLDRVRLLMVEPNLEVWKSYAEQMGIHQAVVSYVNVKKQNFSQIETTVDGKLFATPRGWEDLSQLIQAYEQIHRTIDREVIQEYIQHPRIAKDFANYLELFYKYRSQYQVELILDGTIPPRVLEMLERAPFDERVGVIDLLLSALGNQLRTVWQRGQVLEGLMDYLKAMREQDSFALNPVDACAHMAEMIQEKWERMQKHRLLSRGERVISLEISKMLERYMKEIREEGRHGSDAVWNQLRTLFGKDSDQYEQLFCETGQMLEYSFDFMEIAFADSQEMVMFLTELNTGFYSVSFLQRYECPRYFLYNKSLLFDEQEQLMQNKIAAKQSGAKELMD